MRRAIFSVPFVGFLGFLLATLSVEQANAVIVVESVSNWLDIAPAAQLDEAVVVRGGGVLTIDPGVDVVWVETPDAEIGAITVQSGGTLNAVGLPGSPITFSATHSLGWTGISVEDGATANLEYCSLVGAGYNSNPSLRLGVSTTAVRHTAIDGGGGDGIQLNGSGNECVIEDLTVTGCAGNAVLQTTGDMNPHILGVNFSGNGENAVMIWAGTPSLAGVFREVNWQMTGAPYVVSGWYATGENGVLTIGPGVRVEFTGSPSARQSSIAAGPQGVLNVDGTQENPVVFTSHAASPAPGDWADLAINEEGAGSLENFIIEYAGQWGPYGMRIASSEVSVQNVEIRHVAGDGLILYGPHISPTLDGLVIHDTTAWPLVMRTFNMNPLIGEVFDFHDNPSGNGMLVLAGSGEVTTMDIEWTVNSMPYVIAGWYRVGSGTTFTIRPGVNVTFTAAGTALQSNIQVMSGGALNAGGIPAKPIRFTSFKETPAPGDWAFIQVDQGGTASLDQCRIRHAGNANSAALIIASSEVTVNDLLVEDCQYDGIWLDNEGLSPSLSNVIVRNCGGWGMVQTAISMTPSYSNISLYGNTGGNAIDMWAGTGPQSINRDMHWRFCGAPYAVSGWGRFAPDITLEIDPGVIVQFAPAGASLQSHFDLTTGSRLVAEGTPSQRVLFTSYRSEPVPGDWEVIQFNPGSSGSLDYCTIEYANGSGLEIRSSAVTVKNSIIRNTNWQGVWVRDNAQPSFENNHIENNRVHGAVCWNSAEFPLDLTGTWWGDASGPHHPVLNPSGLGNPVTDACSFDPWAGAPLHGPTLFTWPRTVRIDLTGGDGFVSVANTGAGDFFWNANVTDGQDWLSVSELRAAEPAGFSVEAEPYAGTYQRVGQIVLTTSAPGLSQRVLVVQPGTEGEGPKHTADQDGNMLVSLTELMRVIQFYNSFAFHCEEGTEDGYAPGPGDVACPAHASDYNTLDWRISISELLRLIQFYNSGGYHQNVEGEDGFGAGRLL